MYYHHEWGSIKQSDCRWRLIHIYINEQAYNTPAVDDKQLQMLLSNKVTGSMRGQYRHKVQPTEMHRDFVESKGSTNVGYSDALSRFWIRSSINFKTLHAKSHILGRKAQPLGITFLCLDKNIPFDVPFRRKLSNAPANALTGVNALTILLSWSLPLCFKCQDHSKWRCMTDLGQPLGLISRMDRPSVGPQWLPGQRPPCHTICWSDLPICCQLLKSVIRERIAWPGSLCIQLTSLDFDLLLPRTVHPRLFRLSSLTGVYLLFLSSPTVPFLSPTTGWLYPPWFSAACVCGGGGGGGLNSRNIRSAKVWFLCLMAPLRLDRLGISHRSFANPLRYISPRASHNSLMTLCQRDAEVPGIRENNPFQESDMFGIRIHAGSHDLEQGER